MNIERAQMPNVCRVARLGGGLIAIHNPRALHADIATGLGAPVLGRLDIPSFPAFMHALESQGLRVLGVEFIQSEFELKAVQPPEWRAFCPGRGWTVHEAESNWRKRSFAASKAGDAEFADLAARIAFGLAAAQERVRQTALAYSAQLRGLQVRGRLTSRAEFEDLFGIEVTLSIHAAFYDFGAIRDAIAEFLAGHVFNLRNRGRSWDMTALVAELRKKPVDKPLAATLLQVASSRSKPPGWLYAMSQYRNLFMHVAPLQYTRRTRFALQEMRSFGSLGLLPVLYHPLPEDPVALKNSRVEQLKNRAQHDGGQDAEHAPSRLVEPDALDYLADTLLLLADFSELVSSHAPHQRTPIHLTDADIVGDVKIHLGT